MKEGAQLTIDGIWVTDGLAPAVRLDPDPHFTFLSDLQYFPFGGLMYFHATDGLFVTVGTSGGTHIVKEMVPPGGFTSFDADQFIFLASDPDHGVEPWISDGTELGTFQLTDTFLGPGSSNARGFTKVGDAVLFLAPGGLWISNGTVSGTTVLKANLGALPEPSGQLGVVLGEQLLFGAAISSAQN
jgi:ELWxxDGT repeat protein